MLTEEQLAPEMPKVKLSKIMDEKDIDLQEAINYAVSSITVNQLYYDHLTRCRDFLFNALPKGLTTQQIETFIKQEMNP